MSYIKFAEIAPKVKTKVWEVIPFDGVDPIGHVRWHSPWRQYSFFPAEETVFERKCLRDIAAFCENQTALHRRVRKEGRDAI